MAPSPQSSRKNLPQLKGIIRQIIIDQVIIVSQIFQPNLLAYLLIPLSTWISGNNGTIIILS